MTNGTQKQRVLNQMKQNIWYYSEQLQNDGVGRSSAFRLSELLDEGIVVSRNSPEPKMGKHKQYMLAPPKDISEEYLAILPLHPFVVCPECKGRVYEITAPKKDLFCKPCNWLLSNTKQSKE